jgi:hypothetical protein
MNEINRISFFVKLLANLTTSITCDEKIPEGPSLYVRYITI